MWNFKGTLWNSTLDILPIHWKIWFSYNIKILRALRVKGSEAFLKCPPPPPPPPPLLKCPPPDLRAVLFEVPPHDLRAVFQYEGGLFRYEDFHHKNKMVMSPVYWIPLVQLSGKSWSYSDTYSCSHSSCKKVITAKVCTYQESCAVMTCAKKYVAIWSSVMDLQSNKFSSFLRDLNYDHKELSKISSCIIAVVIWW